MDGERVLSNLLLLHNPDAPSSDWAASSKTFEVSFIGMRVVAIRDQDGGEFIYRDEAAIGY